MEKVAIILVMAGLRPATVLEFEVPISAEPDYATYQLAKTIKSIDALLSATDLLLETSDIHVLAGNHGSQNSLACDVFVGRERETVSRLVASWIAHDTVETGILLGFPSTAVEAFVDSLDGKGKLVDLPASLAHEPWARFLQYRLSEHWGGK